MQIEVTKKEALEIYSQRYFDSKSKVIRYLPPVIFSMALIAGVCLMYFVNDWLGVAVVIIFSSPSIFMSLKAAKASVKHARSQIKE